MKTVSLLGINFYKGTWASFLDEVKNKLSQKESCLIVTPNPEMLYDASDNRTLLEVLKNADYALPDGAGIFVAYQIVESTLPRFWKYFLLPYWCSRAIIHDSSLTGRYGERITGSGLTQNLLDHASKNSIPVTILDPLVQGNTSGDEAKKASQSSIKQSLEKKYPQISCEIIITDTCPEKLPEHGIIFATHGNGRQEILLSEVAQKFPNCGLAIGVGGSIDLMTGFRTPAPVFFQRFGGEWLYRLIKNPKRHLKRVKKVINFILLCIKK